MRDWWLFTDAYWIAEMPWPLCKETLALDCSNMRVTVSLPSKAARWRALILRCPWYWLRCHIPAASTRDYHNLANSHSGVPYCWPPPSRLCQHLFSAVGAVFSHHPKMQLNILVAMHRHIHLPAWFCLAINPLPPGTLPGSSIRNRWIIPLRSICCPL